jgi:ribosome-binding factor A
MAQGRRVERVAASIRREVSELLVTGIKDDRVNLAMVSVTNVDVAGDLQHCKVHVSIFGTEEDRQQALEGLRSASGYVKGELSRRLNMRRTPEVIFLLDRGIEKGTTVLGLINKLGAERLEKGDVPPGSDVEPDAEPGLDPVAEPGNTTGAAGGAAARGPAPAGPVDDDDD